MHGLLFRKKHYDVLGVYLSGTIVYQETVDGKFVQTVVSLPQYIDHKKAENLCRAAMDKKNLSAAKAKFVDEDGNKIELVDGEVRKRV